jgi:membrane protease YdiL (CAAX protease family)
MNPALPELPAKLRIPLWRHFVALVIIGSYPLVSTLSVKIRGVGDSTSTVSFPTSVRGLIIFSLLQLAVFAVFWGISWAISRYDKDRLFLRWKDGIQPVLWGAIYLASLYLTFFIFLIVVAGIMSMFGVQGDEITGFINNNKPQTGGLVNSISSNQDPIYKLLVVTLVPFVVAGLREELWRGATLAGLDQLCPKSWSKPMRNVFAIAISSVVFGLGHLYQGPSGIIITTILGAVMGIIILHHKSIWPAVFMHGFINAISFAAASSNIKP